jgi:hypothetical protein
MTSRTRRTEPATVDVVVVVNHDDLRKGERGTVELTDVVRSRLDSGYLRLATDDDPTPDTGVQPLGGTVATASAEPRGTLLGVDVVATGGGAASAARGADSPSA